MDIQLSSQQYEVLNGALLGDGSLIIHKNGKNAYFSYLSKSKQHVEYVWKYFCDFAGNIYESHYVDKRTEKTYYRASFKTPSSPILTQIYHMWYWDKKKHIPPNIVLTPISCLLWYIGDGSLNKSKNTQYIKLSTHCFEKKELEEYILPQLSWCEPKLYEDKSGFTTQYFIYIPHHKIEDFLNYIGPCPFDDYKYKWAYIPYKNFCINKNPEFTTKLITYFHQGMSSGTIAKLLHVDRSTIVKYLTLNGLDYKQNLYKKVGSKK